MKMMNESMVPCVGAVFSADIAVPEHEREQRFYGRVLRTGTTPLWRDDLMNNQGLPVIGLGARRPEYEKLPLQWMPHIQVADVAASAQRALELGGSELMHAKDDAGRSQWAVLLDPQGAAFGLIPVVPAEAMPPGNAVESGSTPAGRIRWLGLAVRDASTVADFYGQVVGWSVVEVENHDTRGRYTDHELRSADGNPVAAILHARGLNEGLPPVWLLHVAVGDLAESLRRVEEEGGTVIKARHGKDGALLSAAVRDPVGAHLALVPG